MCGVILLVFCFGFKGCSEAEYKRFRAGTKIAAVSLTEVDRTMQDFCRAELLEPGSCDKALPHTGKAANVAVRLRNFTQEHPTLTVESKGEVLALLDDIAAEIDGLSADGVIKFKDQKKQQVFIVSLASARATVAALRVSLD